MTALFFNGKNKKISACNIKLNKDTIIKKMELYVRTDRIKRKESNKINTLLQSLPPKINKINDNKTNRNLIFGFSNSGKT